MHDGDELQLFNCEKCRTVSRLFPELLGAGSAHGLFLEQRAALPYVSGLPPKHTICPCSIGAERGKSKVHIIR